MSLLDRAIDFVQKGEKVVVITTTVFIAGIAAAVAEWRDLVRLDPLPEWVRPSAFLVWIISAAHVAVHALISIWKGIASGVRWLRKWPEKRRRAAYEDVIVTRLLNVGVVEREMLCYALYRRENHIWVPDDGKIREWFWELKLNGLIEVSSAEWRVVHFKIHPVAWAYMQKHPTLFMNSMLWPKEPWEIADRLTDSDADLRKLVIEQIEKHRSK